MTRPLLLDLFCGAGGCAVGYHRAGFDVVGVDHKPQKRYPFPFVQADALRPPFNLQNFDVIHASPPCQRYSTGTACMKDKRFRHPDHVGVTIEMLERSGKPWVVENVMQAPLGHSAMLCGLMFGLKVFRHRRFAASVPIFCPSHQPHGKNLIGIGGFCCVVGHGGGTNGRMRMRGSKGSDCKAAWSKAMGIDWMTRDELSQAIPPAYTEYIGRQLLAALGEQS